MDVIMCGEIYYIIQRWIVRYKKKETQNNNFVETKTAEYSLAKCKLTNRWLRIIFLKKNHSNKEVIWKGIIHFCKGFSRKSINKRMSTSGFSEGVIKLQTTNSL